MARMLLHSLLAAGHAVHGCESSSALARTLTSQLLSLCQAEDVSISPPEHD